MAKEVPQEAKQFVRAVLISAPDGIRQSKFAHDYKKYTGSTLNWVQLGFKDLYEFLLAIPDTARLSYSEKYAENVIFGITKKDVYTSSHAKKAEMKGTGGLKARHPSAWGKPMIKPGSKQNETDRKIDVAKDLSTLKVTVTASGKGEVFTSNLQGLFGIHIRNLPNSCTKYEIEQIFKDYKSLKECKIVVNARNSVAFAKFANEQDAIDALKRRNGYVLRASRLTMNVATEGSTHKNASVVNQLQKPKENSMKTSNSLPTLQGEDGYFTIVISNVSPGIKELELMQLYSHYGVVRKVNIVDRNAFLSFSTQVEAIGTLQNMKEYVFGGQVLTATAKKLETRCDSGMFGNNWTELHNGMLLPLQQPPGSKDFPLRSPPTSNTSPLHVTGSVTGFDRSGTLTPSPLFTSPRDSRVYAPTNAVLQYNRLSTNNWSPTNSNIREHTNQTLDQSYQPPQKHTPTLSNNISPTISQSSSSSGSTCTSRPNSKLPISFILSKEEMEQMSAASGHQVGYRSDNLPEEIDVLVTEVVDACHFWAVIDNKNGNWAKLEELENAIQCPDTCSIPFVPKKYELGAGKFSENNFWYRCFVLDVSSDQMCVKVLYTDYGNSEWIPIQRYTSLDQQLWSLPPQANPFNLAGLEISLSSSGDFMYEGAQYLKNLVCNKAWVARKKPSINSNKPHIIDVELFDKELQTASINSLMAATKFVKRSLEVEIPAKLNSPQLVPCASPDSSTIFMANSKETQIQLTISWVKTPDFIYYNLDCPETNQTLKDIEILLDKIPLSAQFFPQVNKHACLVTQNGKRLRVKVLDIPRSLGGFNSITEVKVFCVDIGQKRTTLVQNLLQMPERLAGIAYQAYPATLFGVKLLDGQSSWPPYAKPTLLNLRNQTLAASIVYQKQDGTKVIKLFNDKGISLNQTIMNLVSCTMSLEAASSRKSGSSESNSSLKKNTRLENKNVGDPRKWKNHGNNVTYPNLSPTSTGMPLVAPKMAKSDGILANYSFEPVNDKGKLLPNAVLPDNQSKASTYSTQSHAVYNNQSPQSRAVSNNQSAQSHAVFNNQSPQSHAVSNNQSPQSHAFSNNQSAQSHAVSNNQSAQSHAVSNNQSAQSHAVSINQSPQSHAVSNNQSGATESFSSKQGAQHSYSESSKPSTEEKSRYSCTLPGSDSFSGPKDSPNLIGHYMPPLPFEPVKRPDVSLASAPQTGLPPQETPLPSQEVSQISTPLMQPLLNGHSSKSLKYEEWQMEKESLVGKIKDQEKSIQILNTQETENIQPPNLQELKARLEIQVRIKASENHALKLRKEIESLESTKAKLQLRLINS